MCVPCGAVCTMWLQPAACAFLGCEDFAPDHARCTCSCIQPPLAVSRVPRPPPPHRTQPGVGKTAIAEGLAQRIVMNDVPENLKVCKFVFAQLLCGCVHALDRREALFLLQVRPDGCVRLALPAVPRPARKR